MPGWAVAPLFAGWSLAMAYLGWCVRREGGVDE